MDTHFLRHGPRVAATLRKRLWQGGIALALFLGTLLVGNFFIRPERAVGAKMIGHDFLAFYSAGTFARRGEFEKLYDLDAVQRFEHQTAAGAGLEIGSSFGPYWNPPFYAWVFAPISALPYQRAWILWELINFTALAGAIVLLARMLPKNDWRTWGLVPLAIIASMPFIQAATHAQNTFTSLLILSAAVTFWRQRRAMLAGAVCGLLFYKPQLAA
ncbi:MAG TPA: glycosyltransferase family 87 protein, partial [Tepidisphaeraceae bacterium]